MTQVSSRHPVMEWGIRNEHSPFSPTYHNARSLCHLQCQCTPLKLDGSGLDAASRPKALTLETNCGGHSGNIQWTFSGHSVNIQQTFREHREQSWIIERTLREHSEHSKHSEHSEHSEHTIVCGGKSFFQFSFRWTVASQRWIVFSWISEWGIRSHHNRLPVPVCDRGTCDHVA
jgi:hypothetical protein